MGKDTRDMILSNRKYVHGFCARFVQSVLSSEFGMNITADELRDFLFSHEYLMFSYQEYMLVDKYYCVLQYSMVSEGPISVEFVNNIYRTVYASRVGVRIDSDRNVPVYVAKDLEVAFRKYSEDNQPRFADRLFNLMRHVKDSRIYCYDIIGRLIMVRELLQAGYPAVDFMNWNDVALAVHNNDREMFYKSLNLMIDEECRIMNEYDMKVEVEEL